MPVEPREAGRWRSCKECQWHYTGVSAPQVGAISATEQTGASLIESDWILEANEDDSVSSPELRRSGGSESVRPSARWHRRLTGRPSVKTVHQLESRMREIRPSGLAGGEAGINRPSLPRS